MNSFSFINSISNIFRKSTAKQNVPMQNMEHPKVITSVATPVAAQSMPSVTSTTLAAVSVNPPTTAQVLPKSIRPELPAVDDNSLENSGLNSCVTSEGDIEVLISKIIIFMSNYLIEVNLQEEDVKAEYAQQVEQTNYKIIHLNNIISNMSNELIPEQEQIVAEYEQKMHDLEQKAQDNHGVLPPSYTIVQFAVVNAKESIRLLKQKMLNHHSDIQKEEYHINSLHKRIAELNFHNPDVLNRRMNIFFEGWVKGLIGLECLENDIARHKQIFIEEQQKIQQQVEEKKQIVGLN